MGGIGHLAAAPRPRGRRDRGHAAVRTGDVAFALVLVWAFAAIYAANVTAPGEMPALAGALGVGVLAFAVAVALAIRRGSSPLPVTT
jgi:hypothetical protein